MPSLDGDPGARGGGLDFSQQVVDAITGRSQIKKGDRKAKASNRWEPDRDLHDESASAEEQERAGARESEYAANGESSDKSDSQLVQAAITYTQNLAERLPQLAQHLSNEAALHFDNAVRLLSDQIFKHPTHASRIARELVGLIAAGWSRGDLLGFNPRGQFLDFDRFAAISPLASEAALIQCANSVGSGGTSSLDRARLAQCGLETHPDYDAGQDLAELDHPAADALREFDWQMVRQRLRDMEPLDDIARKRLTPIIKLNDAYRALAKAKRDAGNESVKTVLATAQAAYAAALAEARTVKMSWLNDAYLGNVWRRATVSCENGQHGPVVDARNGHCVCGSTPPAQILDDLKSPEAVYICPNCLRILVARMPEESS